jgi:hypothetical protein
MDEAVKALELRFPLLKSLRIYNGPGESEALAAFMGVILAAIAVSRHSSFCFVFPRKSRTAPLAAVLYALGRFAVEFPQLADEYAGRTFEKGQRVKLIPGGKVFVFGGLWPGHESRFFRLELVNGKGACSWPVSEILRIEPTHRKRPMGDFSDRAAGAPLSALDKLIGTKTFGNTSLAVNHVLYLGGRTEFGEFLSGTSLVSAGCQTPVSGHSLISPGTIGESGNIRHEDNYQAAGEPFIALSSRIEHVAAACKAAPQRSKVVIVDGARRITEFASFDAIAETQNMIIVAEVDEEEKLRQLFDRGCRFWRFSLADLEMGGGELQAGRFFGGILRAARNQANFKTEVLGCENPHLDKASVALETCQSHLEESEGDETQSILQQLYGLLMHCAGLLEAPGPEEHQRLREKAALLSRASDDRMMWLAEPVARALRDACAEITCAIDASDLGVEKGKVLSGLIAGIHQRAPGQIAIVARSASNRMIVTRWLDGAGLEYPVVLLSNAGETGSFELLICTAWPNSANFGKLVRQYAAPLIYLVAYPFECRWLQRFNRRQRTAERVPDIKPSEKSELLGISGGTTWPAEPVVEIPADIYTDTEEDRGYDFEERLARGGLVPAAEPGEEVVAARLVHLSGDAYAFLTETSRIPVITDLVSGTAGENYKIPRRRPEQLRIGDFLIFRDGGRRDVIQALADAQLGAEAPRIRELAARWHKALRESEMNETALLNELDEVGCPRTLQTVRAWLGSDAMIGPQTRADLEAIAYAVGDQKLLNEVPDIWEAIKTLRSEHLSAGMRLSRILLKRLPEHLGELREGATRIDIDDATSAWVVQVEGIAEQTAMRPRSHVNTILWHNEDLV